MSQKSGVDLEYLSMRRLLGLSVVRVICNDDIGWETAFWNEQCIRVEAVWAGGGNRCVYVHDMTVDASAGQG